MSLRDIVDRLDDTLGLYAAHPLLAGAPNDIYEAYLFCIVVEAARAEGAAVTWRAADGKETAQLLFRRSPGVISSQSPFTHALLELPYKEPLELHVGVRVMGVSDTAHECDVAVIKQEECERARRGDVLPKSKSLVVALEAKYYASSLPLYLGRGFLGLGRDFKGVSLELATNVRSENVINLLLHHKLGAHDEVLPAQPAHSRLLGKLRNVFHQYGR